MEAATPVFWVGVLVLFVLISHRTGWNFRESIMVLIGLRGSGNVTTLELLVGAGTIGGTFFVFLQVLDACKPS